MKKHLLRAIPERNAQTAVFQEFSLSQAPRVPAWKRFVDEFNTDTTKPNPYSMPKSKTMMQAEVRKGFAEQDKKEANNGRAFTYDVSAHGFLMQALDLQDQQ